MTNGFKIDIYIVGASLPSLFHVIIYISELGRHAAHPPSASPAPVVATRPCDGMHFLATVSSAY